MTNIDTKKQDFIECPNIPFISSPNNKLSQE